MRNAHPKYLCYPSVICVGKQTKVTIVPRDNSRIFRDGKKYQLGLLGLFEDMTDHHAPIDYDTPVTVENGCLTFTITATAEQEYFVYFAESGAKPTRISIYAVEEDLYNLRPLKGDFHTHTYYSDGSDGIAMTPADYREEGFDFFALTDHNRMYTSVLANDLYDGVPLGIHIMQGEEVHTPGSILHIVHAGGKTSVCKKYIHNLEQYEQQVDEIEKTLTSVNEKYRRRAAMAVWACNEIHKAGGIAIFAHPFWCPKIYNVSREFSDILFNLKIFDAFEIMGGIESKHNNLQLALWQEQAFKGNVVSVVGSSDSHNHDFDKNCFGRNFTIVFAKSNTTEDILNAVSSGYSVAAELPLESNTDIRFYGSQLRLISFARFLYENYFNQTWRLCVGEGILMRRYAEGEPVGELLSSFKDTVNNFYLQFYGKLPAPLIIDRCKDFLDTCLEYQQKEGPLTKGGSIFVYGGNERRE